VSDLDRALWLEPGAPLVVISPHLDDGVFGCGELLAAHPGSVVITALAGRPDDYGSLSEWDAAAGFGPDDDRVAVRRAEDAEALATLGARPIWLDLVESQYAPEPPLDAVAAALEPVLFAEPASAVLLPLGLFHSDHKLVHEAGLRLLRRHASWHWIGYAEPNSRLVDNLLEERLQALEAGGFDPRPLGCSDGEYLARKRQAVLAYRSQIRAFEQPKYPGWSDMLAPERYWRLSSEASV
jgi:LmbE family N-acetylglucosaminyl deacetylase